MLNKRIDLIGVGFAIDVRYFFKKIVEKALAAVWLNPRSTDCKGCSLSLKMTCVFRLPSEKHTILLLILGKKKLSLIPL